MKKAILLFIFQLCSLAMFAQINTDRVLTIGRNALYFEDYVLSIQYFNQVIKSKPWLAEPYFYRAVAKINLDDYKGAEEDCTLCLERNPFLVQAYYARGIARQSQEKFDEAIEDYRKGLEFKAEDLNHITSKRCRYQSTHNQYIRMESLFRFMQVKIHRQPYGSQKSPQKHTPP